MLVAIIFKKHSRLSEATNKEFDHGEIVNFVQVDANRVFMVCQQVILVARTPFLFLIAFTAFFYYYQWTFLSGIAVMGIAIGIQTCTSIKMSKIQKRVMEAKDTRMRVTTESLNHVKMLKLYSWVRNFVKRIHKKRRDEIARLRTKVIYNSAMIAGTYFFPNMVSFAVFSTYIFLGNHLTLEVAIGSLILFTMVNSAMNDVPFFLNVFLDMLVSNRRIQRFL